MFSEKAYSVRLALVRNKIRLVATAHLTCRRPTLPSAVRFRLAGRDVDRRTGSDFLAKRLYGRQVRVLPFEPVGYSTRSCIRHVTPSGPYERFSNPGHVIDGVTDQDDPAARRVEDLENRLLGPAERARPRFRPGPTSSTACPLLG